MQPVIPQLKSHNCIQSQFEPTIPCIFGKRDADLRKFQYFCAELRLTKLHFARLL